MTRQEAIKHLEKLQTIGNLSDETLSAFSNAIFALECWDGAENTLDKVLKIIDSNLPHGVIWQEDSWQCGWHDGLTKIRGMVEALKGDAE